MQDSTAYIGLDVHSATSTLTWLDEDGVVQGRATFDTSEEEMIEAVEEIDAEEKYLTLEEGPLAYWTARALANYVDRTVVCDPRENFLISRSLRKGDAVDSQALARLLRLDELREVYQPASDRRALYKQAINHYLDRRDQQRALKQKIKARLKRWGLWNIPGTDVYSRAGREAYLEELCHDRIRTQVESLYRMLDVAHEEKTLARQELIELGQPYQEVQEFKKIPGMGAIGAHTFDAIIQTPHRFAGKRKLWSYCKLAIYQPSSGGDEPAYEELGDHGHGELKRVSYQAYVRALGSEDPNEVKRFVEASRKRTGDKMHARLNAQRKILATMWGLWKNGTPYDPALFLG